MSHSAEHQATASKETELTRGFSSLVAAEALAGAADRRDQWRIVKLASSGWVTRVNVVATGTRGQIIEVCAVDEPVDSSGRRPFWFRIGLLDESGSWTAAREDPSESRWATHIRFQTPVGDTTEAIQLEAYGVAFPDPPSVDWQYVDNVDPTERERLCLRWLNTAPDTMVERALHACCASGRWTDQVLARRPYDDFEDLLTAASETADQLGADDWLEAFTSHARIGQLEELSRWDRQEQQGLSSALQETTAELLEGTRIYEEKFGRIFVVCASTKTATAMLLALQTRLDNDAETEFEVTVDEERKITSLRLAKLIGRPQERSTTQNHA